jgi:hypothetical protein
VTQKGPHQGSSLVLIKLDDDDNGVRQEDLIEQAYVDLPGDQRSSLSASL